MNHLTIQCSDNSGPRYEWARLLARDLDCSLAINTEPPKEGMAICFDESKVSVVDARTNRSTLTWVDFIGGSKAHRRKFGGGKGQAIAKAVGLNKQARVSVLDATAGMGSDAFVLATLGCKVTMIERAPVVRVLLQDGLQRARVFAQSEDPELFDIINRMHLLQGDSLTLLQTIEQRPQVVYLDPMFPERKKSALVKKEMQIFHELVGKDEDADALLEPALALASHRVVVKRPKIAPFLGGREPGYQLVGKAGRFDIYPLRAF